MMELTLWIPWSRQMTSRDGSPVAAGFTSPTATLRFARAWAVSFTKMALDMNRGFWPRLLVPAPDPLGDGARSIIAKANAVDKTNRHTAIDKDTVLLRDLYFIFSFVSSGVEYDFARFTGNNQKCFLFESIKK